ncbi:hypothetical protein KFE25_000995 [Diacronema lutheri]|uniref:Telomeric single stranded DNA binding POT1/Cdc13 domain-containing protein n=1 Tax=Diacronema lutheri TaxID=2081491 RepID=A0A8J6C3V6_DIALT|nr:hypothetical protein KFE25_000995 [Diacronema lutheri]
MPPPALPPLLLGALQLRSFDGRACKLRLTNVEAAADANIELVCADGWEEGVGALPIRQPFAIAGARVEPHAAHLPPWRLVLDASAPANALVVVEAAGKRIEVRRDGVRATDLFGGGSARARARGGAPPDGGATARYEYTPIAALTARQYGPDGRVLLERNVYGVVIDYAPPVRTKGMDMMSSLRIVDPTCASSEHGLQLNLFRAHPYVPHVGAVVRVHRALLQPKAAPPAGAPPAPSYATNTSCGRGRAGTTTSVHCLALDERGANEPQAAARVVSCPSAPPGAIATVRVDAHDTRRVGELQQWARELLSDPDRARSFLAARQYQRTLAEVPWALEMECGTFVDLVCRVDSVSAHPPATHPRTQPCGSMSDNTIARLPECAHSARSVDLWLDDSAHAASLLEQLQHAARTMADVGLELWVRARSVRVFATHGPPRRAAAVLVGNSRLAVLPHYHIDVRAASARLVAAAAHARADEGRTTPPWQQAPPSLHRAAGAGVPIALGSPTAHAHVGLEPVTSLGRLTRDAAPRARWRVQARVAAVLPDAPREIARARCAACGGRCALAAADARGDDARGDAREPHGCDVTQSALHRHADVTSHACDVTQSAAPSAWACDACGERAAEQLRWEYRAALLLEDSACVLAVLVSGEQARTLFAREPRAERAPGGARDGGAIGGDGGGGGIGGFDQPPCARDLAARVAALCSSALVDVCVQAYEHKRARCSSPNGERRCARVRHFQLFDTVLASRACAAETASMPDSQW